MELRRFVLRFEIAVRQSDVELDIRQDITTEQLLLGVVGISDAADRQQMFLVEVNDKDTVGIDAVVTGIRQVSWL